VIGPLAATLATTLTLVLVLAQRRRGRIAWCEIGLVYAAIVTLYAVYPLVGFLVLGQSYSVHNDLRLQQLAPDASTVGRIGWLYTLHLLAFVTCYLAVRGRLPMHTAPPASPRMSVGISALVLFLAIQAFWLILGWFYDTSAETYVESYLVARRLPLILAQALGHLSGAKYPLMIALLVLLFSRYPASRPIIIAWFILTAALTGSRLGSRTEFALFVFAAAIIYHSLVRPVSARVMTVGAAAGVLAFIAFGILRSGAAASGATMPWYVVPFSYASDFEVLFANAMHLDRIAASGTELRLPPGFYLSDLLALVPQQLAPYVKVDPSAWYVGTFFPEYAAIGGGLAFGLIAESVVTGGWLSAVARGALLGLLYAFAHRNFARHGHRFWMFVFYVWLTTLSYQAFRATTLYLLVPVVYRFLFVMIVVKVTASLIDRASRARAQRAPVLTRPRPDSTVRYTRS
jgi:oligosaccharide repeat unit polymerase